MAGRNPPWTRDELILALDIYIRYGRYDLPSDHEQVAGLSDLLTRASLAGCSYAVHPRSRDSVHMKLGNLVRLDDLPGREIRPGLQHGSTAELGVWAEFASDPGRLQQTAAAIRAILEGRIEAAEKDGEGTDRPEAPDAGALDGEEGEPEGRLLRREHLYRERNRKLVSKKKDLALQKDSVLRCEVCGFVFSEVYGPTGEGIIECHHVVPLHQLGPHHWTRLEDLALVCANCHRVLHSGKVETIAELRNYYEANNLS